MNVERVRGGGVFFWWGGAEEEEKLPTSQPNRQCEEVKFSAKMWRDRVRERDLFILCILGSFLE